MFFCVFAWLDCLSCGNFVFFLRLYLIFFTPESQSHFSAKSGRTRDLNGENKKHYDALL
jgi:hypothetical protein